MLTSTRSNWRTPQLKTAKERMDVIGAYRELGSFRADGAVTGTTHKTVRRIVESAEAGPPEHKVRGHNYEQVTEIVRARILRTKGRITAKRLLPEARAAGYEGSARNFRRLVSEEKELFRRDNHRGRRPGVWAPGEVLVIDWGPSPACMCSVPSRPGAVSASCAFPTTNVVRRPCASWPSVSRSCAGSPRSCSPTAWDVSRRPWSPTSLSRCPTT